MDVNCSEGFWLTEAIIVRFATIDDRRCKIASFRESLLPRFQYKPQSGNSRQVSRRLKVVDWEEFKRGWRWSPLDNEPEIGDRKG